MNFQIAPSYFARCVGALTVLTLCASLPLLTVCAAPMAATDKPRYAVVTDMTHDDGNSLIRLLYYANDISRRPS